MARHIIDRPEHVKRQARHRAPGRHSLPVPGSNSVVPLAPVTTVPVVPKAHVRPFDQWREWS